MFRPGRGNILKVDGPSKFLYLALCLSKFNETFLSLWSVSFLRYSYLAPVQTSLYVKTGWQIQKNRRSSQVLLNRKFHNGCRFCRQHSPRQWGHPFIYLLRSFRLLLCFVFLLEILRKSLPLNSFVGKCKFSTVYKGCSKAAQYPKRSHWVICPDCQGHQQTEGLRSLPSGGKRPWCEQTAQWRSRCLDCLPLECVHFPECAI